MVTKWGWGGRQGEVSIPGEVKNAIVIDGTKQRCPALLPIGDQLGEATGIHDSSGKNVGPDLFPFFEDSDRSILHQLSQMVGGSQARRAGANDQNVNFEDGAFG